MMANSTLSTDQATALLRKLATDDAFRTLFEKDPASALRDIGVESETIQNLKSECRDPSRLLAKDEFQKAVDQLDKNFVEETAAMQSPNLWSRSR